MFSNKEHELIEHIKSKLSINVELEGGYGDPTLMVELKFGDSILDFSSVSLPRNSESNY